ncbi:hypothetical protein RFI_32079, partial [Reticulomyxa filosa]
YRVLHLNNPELQKSVLQLDGGLEFLYNLGYIPSQENRQQLVCRRPNPSAIKACLRCLTAKIEHLRNEKLSTSSPALNHLEPHIPMGALDQLGSMKKSSSVPTTETSSAPRTNTVSHLIAIPTQPQSLFQVRSQSDQSQFKQSQPNQFQPNQSQPKQSQPNQSQPNQSQPNQSRTSTMDSPNTEKKRPPPPKMRPPPPKKALTQQNVLMPRPAAATTVVASTPPPPTTASLSQKHTAPHAHSHFQPPEEVNEIKKIWWKVIVFVSHATDEILDNDGTDAGGKKRRTITKKAKTTKTSNVNSTASLSKHGVHQAFALHKFILHHRHHQSVRQHQVSDDLQTVANSVNQAIALLQTQLLGDTTYQFIYIY